MKKWMLFLSLITGLFFSTNLATQTFKLDVDGDVKIRGVMDVGASTSPSSLFIGRFSGLNNTTGDSNTGFGFNTLREITMGANNTAMGVSALLQNTTGHSNTALGYFAASNNISGSDNTAVGNLALLNNTTGSSNTAVGGGSLVGNTVGFFNTAVGSGANVGSNNLSNVTVIGANSFASQSNSLILGNNANVGIGTSAPLAKLHIVGSKMRIATPGNAGKYMELRTDGNDVDLSSTGAKLFLTGNNSMGVIIQQNPGNVAVGNDTSPDFKLEVVGSAGKPGGGLWTDSSDRRLKKEVEDFEDGLAAVLKIRPVWYRFNGKFGLPTEERYVGVIAQEMQQVAPYTVDSYIETDNKTGETGEYLNYNGTAVVYMLVNAVQEQQERIEEQQLEIRELRKLVYALLEKESSTSPAQSLHQQAVNLTDARLYPNQPNPFSETTIIRYYIPQGNSTSQIQITSVEGKIIKVIPIQVSGEGELTVNAHLLSAGTYLYSLLLNGQVIATEKMVLTGKN